MPAAAPQPTFDAGAQMRFDDDGGTTVRTPTLDSILVPPRQCGRCRGMFEGDPTLVNPGTMQEWWLCPPCRTALLGDRPNRSTDVLDKKSTGTNRAG
jgi:hypothetical protein